MFPLTPGDVTDNAHCLQARELSLVLVQHVVEGADLQRLQGQEHVLLARASAHCHEEHHMRMTQVPE